MAFFLSRSDNGPTDIFLESGLPTEVERQRLDDRLSVFCGGWPCHLPCYVYVPAVRHGRMPEDYVVRNSFNSKSYGNVVN